MAINPNIILEGARMGLANDQQRMAIFDNFAKTLMAQQEAEKERAYKQQVLDVESKYKNAQIEELKRKSSLLDLDALESSGLVKAYSGLTPSASELAAIQAKDAVRQTQLGTDMMGNVYPKAKSIMGLLPQSSGMNQPTSTAQQSADMFQQGGGQPPIMPAAVDRVSAMDLFAPAQMAGSEGIKLDSPSIMDTFERATAPQQQKPVYSPAQTGVEGTPYGKKISAESRVKMGEEAFKKEYDLAIEMMKSDIGKQKMAQNIGPQLARLQQINEELRDRRGIVSESAGLGSRLTGAAKSTGVGQAIGKVSDPKTEALRKEFASIRNSIMPYYAAAAGLSSKQMDTPAEREAYLSTIGDPTGIYETNVNQLANIERLLIGSQGQQPKQAPKSGITFLGFE